MSADDVPYSDDVRVDAECSMSTACCTRVPRGVRGVRGVRGEEGPGSPRGEVGVGSPRAVPGVRGERGEIGEANACLPRDLLFPKAISL
jgi:hypothetical protein